MWILFYWYCCGGCYVSEVLGIEWVLSLDLGLLFVLGGLLASVSIVPVRPFSLLLFELPTASSLASSVSSHTLRSCPRRLDVRPDCPLSLSTVITLRARHWHIRK